MGCPAEDQLAQRSGEGGGVGCPAEDQLAQRSGEGGGVGCPAEDQLAQRSGEGGIEKKRDQENGGLDLHINSNTS